MAEEFIDIEVESFREDNWIDIERMQVIVELAESAPDRLGLQKAVYVGRRGLAGIPDFAFAGEALI